MAPHHKQSDPTESGGEKSLTKPGKFTIWLAAAAFTSFVVALLLPAVDFNMSLKGAWYNPDSSTVVPGWLCTILHPAGWATILVQLMGVVFFLLRRYRRKRLARAFIAMPACALIYSIVVSVQILLDDRNNRLLAGHYLWQFSIVLALATYWALGSPQKET